MSGSGFVPKGDLPQQQNVNSGQAQRQMPTMKPSRSDSEKPQSSRRFGPEIYRQEFGDIGNPLAGRVK